jgi:thiol-disulfide isomerase/thioredoxin
MEFLNKEILQAPVLLEKDLDSLTIAWNHPSQPFVLHYELEMSHDEATWTVISATLKNNLVRKKNLQHGCGYRFRVRFEDKEGNWSAFSQPSEPFYTLEESFRLMKAPTLLSAESSAITVEWQEVPEATGYRIRFRKDDELTWHVVDAEIKGNKAKKKSLSPGNYYFAVHPVTDSKETEATSNEVSEEPQSNWSFSPAGGPFSTVSVNPFYQQLLPAHLINNQLKKVEMADVLGGKVVALYFSAHWCPPCRQFTPRLADLYRQARAAGKKFEVVFCSCDHTEEEFKGYFTSEMPWFAINYDDHQREEVSGKFRVSSIPRLVILSTTGKVIVDNAAGGQLSLAQVDEWIKQG